MDIPLKPDCGYNAYFFKINENKAIGLGELEGLFGPPEEIEAWCFNEFSNEALQLGTIAIDFRLKSRIKCLHKLKKNVNKQIKILEEQEAILHKKNYEKNSRYHRKHKKSIKSESI